MYLLSRCARLKAVQLSLPLSTQCRSIMAQKRPYNEGRSHFKKNKRQKGAVTEGSNEDVLLADVRALLRNTHLSPNGESPVEQALPEQYSQIDLEITDLSSTGDGLAQKDGHVYVVPFTAPGDIISAKIVKHFPTEHYTLTDFLSVKTPSPHRTETPRCRYFAQCSGCQFQHLPYTYQLAHKRRIVEKAFANFSNLPPSAIPAVGDTIGSPRQYAYRTKLTPHFDGPTSGRRDRRMGKKVEWKEVPPIGYMLKGTRRTLDIEECPIGTEAVQRGLRRERERVKAEISKYQRGATLLLRESTERVKKNVVEGDEKKNEEENEDVVMEDRGEWIHRHSCITDNKATSTEYVEDFRFDNPAGAFFQNNNSILPLVTQYIRDNILGLETTTTDTAAVTVAVADNSTHPPTSTLPPTPRIKNLIDAYCGSGFFTITLSSIFARSIGIDISEQSIASARHNASLNSLPTGSTRFIAADANALFSSVDVTEFPPAETAVVIDPPRKGCDKGFIRQLLEYAPERVCYVSCNVHTQARDVGWLVGGLGHGEEEEEEEGAGGGGGGGTAGLYEIESLRGFDFFPQTGHVEGVAILRKKKKIANDAERGADETSKG